MGERVRRWWLAMHTVFRVWRQRIRQRDELSRMTEAELSDAGISSYEARFEIRKPFWRG